MESHAGSGIGASKWEWTEVGLTPQLDMRGEGHRALPLKQLIPEPRLGFEDSASSYQDSSAGAQSCSTRNTRGGFVANGEH